MCHIKHLTLSLSLSHKAFCKLHHQSLSLSSSSSIAFSNQKMFYERPSSSLFISTNFYSSIIFQIHYFWNKKGHAALH